MKRIILTVVAAGIAISGTAFASQKAPGGAELLESRCSECHPSARPKGFKRTAAQWEATVTKMMAKGAKLSAEEKKILVDYLTKTYKP